MIDEKALDAFTAVMKKQDSETWNRFTDTELRICLMAYEAAKEQPDDCREAFENKYGKIDYPVPVMKEAYFELYQSGWNARPMRETGCGDCDSYATEIHEIVRVARDNLAGLKEFLMLNFPKEWGLTKSQHKALYSGASVADVEVEE
jgi:hypothetical protein